MLVLHPLISGQERPPPVRLPVNRAQAEPGSSLGTADFKYESGWWPREDSNLRTRFRKPLLYPLSYEATYSDSADSRL